MYNSQHNGVVEKNNQSIIGYSKAMIHDQDLPMFLLAETSNMIIYIHNGCLHRIVKDKTLEDAFIGVNSKVSHFHIFGV
jgi:hypothetical protein